VLIFWIYAHSALTLHTFAVEETKKISTLLALYSIDDVGPAVRRKVAPVHGKIHSVLLGSWPPPSSKAATIIYQICHISDLNTMAPPQRGDPTLLASRPPVDMHRPRSHRVPTVLKHTHSLFELVTLPVPHGCPTGPS
jgi:hypothetical protein